MPALPSLPRPPLPTALLPGNLRQRIGERLSLHIALSRFDNCIHGAQRLQAFPAQRLG